MSLRPIPGDPSAESVAAMIDIRNDEWWVSAPGDYRSAAVEAFNREGGNYQRLIALEWPARLNNGDERRTIRLLIAPEDALGLAEVLTHSARWLRAAAILDEKGLL